jgi:hypothetical protein
MWIMKLKQKFILEETATSEEKKSPLEYNTECLFNICILLIVQQVTFRNEIVKGNRHKRHS